MKKLPILAAVGLLAFWVGGAPGSGPAWAVENVLLDFVDIGDKDSEKGHGLVGWGPIEPDTHGGGWGELAAGGYPDLSSVDKKARVVWYSDFDGNMRGTWDGYGCTPDSPGDLNGPEALVSFSWKSGAAHALVIRALDGFGDDSFTVDVRGAGGEWINVYTWNDATAKAAGGAPTWWIPETWKIHRIDLTLYEGIGLGRGELEVLITSTAPAWIGWCPYGQLAVDRIELWGSGKPRD